MRNYPVVMSVVALMLSSCSAKVELPTDLVEKAATCAVVSAAEARSTMKDVDKPLPFERQSQIIHYALLAGAGDPKFSRENANHVVRRMQTLQEMFADDEWKPLVAPCNAAFPQASPGYAVTLPADPAEAQLTCYALGDFMSRALSAYEETYGDKLIQYDSFLTRLKPIVAAEAPKGAGKRAADSAQMAKRSAALAVAAKLGPPAKVMDACLQRFPDDAKATKKGATGKV